MWQIFEQTDLDSELGAAIGVTPNGSWVLKHWNLDPAAIGGVPARGTKVVNGQTLDELYSDSTYASSYGIPFWLFHRVDLHHRLREYATSNECPGGPPVELKPGSSVQDIDCDHGRIILEGNDEVQKDLVIVADGVRVSRTYAGILHKLTSTVPLHPQIYCSGAFSLWARHVLLSRSYRLFRDRQTT